MIMVMINQSLVRKQLSKQPKVDVCLLWEQMLSLLIMDQNEYLWPLLTIKVPNHLQYFKFTRRVYQIYL